MLRMNPEEYRCRVEALQSAMLQAGLDLFIVSSFDSIYYLTRAGFEPLERPFFLLVCPRGSPSLIIPKLDHEHMKKAHCVPADNIHTYWEYPASDGRPWSHRLREQIENAQSIGIEPTLRQEIVNQISGYSLRLEPLVERLRLVKTPTEVRMIERAAMYADYGVKGILCGHGPQNFQLTVSGREKTHETA